MIFRITHTTRYRYGRPVSLCHNETHLVPRDTRRQRVLSATVEIDPKPIQQHRRTDFFGNTVGYFSLETAHKTMQVSAVSTVEVVAASPVMATEAGGSSAWEKVRDTLPGDTDAEALEARQFLLDSVLCARRDELTEYALASFPPGRPIIEGLRDLNTRIHADFAYDPHFTTIATPLSEVFEHRRGVCQDFAHLAIACLRGLDLPARYVSGYLETEPPPGQEKLQGADASHAWFSAYVPDVGWMDFDPTNNTDATDHHVTVAWGRDFDDVTPLNGVALGGGAHTLEVEVDVTRMKG